jgi:hypothetical protein
MTLAKPSSGGFPDCFTDCAFDVRHVRPQPGKAGLQGMPRPNRSSLRS